MENLFKVVAFLAVLMVSTNGIAWLLSKMKNEKAAKRLGTLLSGLGFIGAGAYVIAGPTIEVSARTGPVSSFSVGLALSGVGAFLLWTSIRRQR
ncbi:hypothetical protein [Oryzomicrobium terrae]|uniref:hypothetical protein n=1 Tax=Oryzomicrobium terrae TaxID=1735038 RepID=UPI0011EDA913|nr:hypothetical protein [Oryzomicrobium terrae]